MNVPSITVLALIGLAGSLAALIALLEDLRRGDPSTLGYWTTNSERYR